MAVKPLGTEQPLPILRCKTGNHARQGSPLHLGAKLKDVDHPVVIVAATYQRVPALIDERLAAAGATALLARGAADASGDFGRAVDRWTADLWAALLERYGEETDQDEATPQPVPEATTGLYAVEDAADSVTGELAAPHGLQPMEVLDAYELVDTGP